MLFRSATPLGLDIYIRLPETISNSRLATIARPSLVEMLRGFGLRFTLEAMNRRSKIVRALRGSEVPHDQQRIYARNLEVPSGGGVGTARAIAHAYSVFATGGSELGLRRETLDLLAAPATPPARGFYDECLKGDGVQFSLGFMMKSNYLRLADVARVAKQFEAPLRVNVYQAVRSDIYALSYEEYWEGFRRLFEETDVIAIGEPLVRAMAGLPPLKGGCGVSTVRVTPRGTTQPCVYWPGTGEPLLDLISAGTDILDSAPFEQARTLPQACQPCEFRDSCHGGCAGRRRLQGALLEPDSYCPIIRGQRPRLEIRMAANRDLPKLRSSCTTVVMAR